LIFTAPKKISIDTHSKFAYIIRIYVFQKGSSSNITILLVLLSMIIRPTEREDFRRVNENDLDIDDRERIEFIAPEIRDLFRLRSVAQRTRIFGTQKNRLLIS